MLSAKSPQLEADLAVVRKGRIFFSHHSVGENILEGVQRVLAESGGAPLRIASLDEAATAKGPALFHGSGGQNKDPVSKIAFFEATIRGNPSLRPDVAFMKLCYVDFSPSTDVDALFARYQRAITELKREQPGIRFAHVTVPLTRRQTDLKSKVRRLLGLEVWGDASNAKRYEFNQRLLRAFATDPVFHLAQVESTDPGGAPVSFDLHGKRIPSLAPDYTDDGGHLNAMGQRVAGIAAIRFVAASLANRPTTRTAAQ